LKILVYIKEVRDIKIPLEYDAATLQIREDGAIYELNPADVQAMETALKIKDEIPGTHITLIHMGPVSGERWIREGYALGCDAGLRICDQGLGELKACGKAMIFAQVAKLLGYDLILTGNRSQDTMSGQVGILLAGYLGLPVITNGLSLEVDPGRKAFLLERSLSKGYRERVQCNTPLLVTMETTENAGRYASLPALIDASNKEIPRWSLQQMGIPEKTIKNISAQLKFSPLYNLKPQVKPVAAPDPSLPAFERVIALLEGTIKRRAGNVAKNDNNVMVEELLEILIQHGLQ
jgi:electron transfer flavoprotein beta subunit